MVGLYDVFLLDMILDVFYFLVCDKWVRIIVLVRDVKVGFLYMFFLILI